jgi:hypothetical protein
MFRPIAILLALGLVGTTMGCHHTHGVCDCELGANGHDQPVLMAPGPLRPEPVPVMPKPAEPTPPPPSAETPK